MSEVAAAPQRKPMTEPAKVAALRDLLGLLGSTDSIDVAEAMVKAILPNARLILYLSPDNEYRCQVQLPGSGLYPVWGTSTTWPRAILAALTKMADRT